MVWGMVCERKESVEDTIAALRAALDKLECDLEDRTDPDMQSFLQAPVLVLILGPPLEVFPSPGSGAGPA